MSAEGSRIASEQLYKLAWGFYLLLGLGGVVWIGAREEQIRLEAFLQPSTVWVDSGLGLATGALLLAVWAGAARLLPLARELEDRLHEILAGLERPHAIALALMSGFAEELFFRGAVQGSWGYLPATLLFAALHSGRERAFRMWTAFALVAGLVFGGLVVWRGTLLPAILAHALVNAVNLDRLAAKRNGEDDRAAA